MCTRSLFLSASLLAGIVMLGACAVSDGSPSTDDTDTAASSGGSTLAVDDGATGDTTRGADEGSEAGSSTGAGPTDPPSSRPFQELYDQGVDRYVGTFEPTSSDRIDDSVIHRFVGNDGPLCYTGEEFNMTTRDGSSDALLIFVQGGGLCGPNACDAVESWPPGILNFGMLDPTVAGNPVADFDVGYIPYCDGSLFTGDREVDLDDDGIIDRSHRGVQNLSASLDVIAATYPTPSMIVLAGNSAGGFGTHSALPLVRLHYPDVRIDLVNDSGIGIGNPGGQEALNAYWDAESFYPASCADCIGTDGNLTGYHSWQLDEDPNVRMGFLSSKRDDRIVSGFGLDGEAFEAQLLAAMDELEGAHPDRVRSLIADDDSHTFILRQFERVVAGYAVKDWIGAMVEGGDDWRSAVE